MRSPFGWHLIQVLERRTQDITIDRARDEARTAIRQRKSDEAFQDWVRQMRDRGLRRDSTGRPLDHRIKLLSSPLG